MGNVVCCSVHTVDSPELCQLGLLKGTGQARWQREWQWRDRWWLGLSLATNTRALAAKEDRLRPTQPSPPSAAAPSPPAVAPLARQPPLELRIQGFPPARPLGRLTGTCPHTRTRLVKEQWCRRAIWGWRETSIAPSAPGITFAMPDSIPGILTFLGKQIKQACFCYKTPSLLFSFSQNPRNGEKADDTKSFR